MADACPRPTCAFDFVRIEADDESLYAEAERLAGVVAGAADRRDDEDHNPPTDGEPQPRLVPSSPRMLLLGPRRSGRTSLAFEYARKAAARGSNVILVANKKHLNANPPLPFAGAPASFAAAARDDPTGYVPSAPLCLEVQPGCPQI